MTGPADVPWGGAFGTTGPDTGYAARLVASRELALSDHEERHNAEAAVVAIAGARASLAGRAPTGQDIDAALVLLGYDPTGLPHELVADLVDRRRDWTANLNHDAVASRALVAAIDPDVLKSTAEQIRARMRAGEDLIDR
ncbi:MAG: hypothetical protein ACR2NL_11825 [Acidimicrobiia bacterium]